MLGINIKEKYPRYDIVSEYKYKYIKKLDKHLVLFADFGNNYLRCFDYRHDQNTDNVYLLSYYNKNY